MEVRLGITDDLLVAEAQVDLDPVRTCELVRYRYGWSQIRFL